jgi:5-methylcytosine-specific restriction endonuclease McrA
VRRPCRGCGALIPAGTWCPICQPPRTRGRALQALRAAYVAGRPCVTCGRPAEQLDHVRPVSRGGDDRPTNLRPLCRKCNRDKGDH